MQASEPRRGGSLPLRGRPSSVGRTRSFGEAMSEIQTCPSRVNQVGPWEHGEGLDRWETDRWLVDPEAVAAKHIEEDARHAAEIRRISGRDPNPVHRGPN